MYYEARIHQIVEVASAIAAAEKIRSESMYTYQVMKWTSKDGNYYMYAVPDGHLDEMLAELAILRQNKDQEDAPYQQIESITNGWIEGTDMLARYLQDAESSTMIMKSNAQLIIDKPKGDEQASFTCGCCGSWFKDNVQKQLKFDQDAGYGICDRCQHWH